MIFVAYTIDGAAFSRAPEQIVRVARSPEEQYILRAESGTQEKSKVLFMLLTAKA